MEVYCSKSICKGKPPLPHCWALYAHLLRTHQMGPEEAALAVSTALDVAIAEKYDR